MIAVNPLKTKVLITTDEVVYHAPVDHEVDPRVLLQSIIVAERRFIKPMIGAAVYKALTDAKNILITSANIDAQQSALNEARGAGKGEIVLVEGDYVNADTSLTAKALELWSNYLHKITAECVYFSALTVNRNRFTSQGVQTNNPESLASDRSSVSVDLRSLKHLMDRTLQDRISPLMEDMHQFMCDTQYPEYDKDCGCSSDGVPYSRKSDIILGMYDDNEDDCKSCYPWRS